MRKTTYKLANLYIKSGNTELAEEFIKYDLAFARHFPTQEDKKYRSCNEYGHTLKSVEGFHFHRTTGFCPTCEVLSLDDYRYDGAMSEMQNSNNGRGL